MVEPLRRARRTEARGLVVAVALLSVVAACAGSDGGTAAPSSIPPQRAHEPSGDAGEPVGATTAPVTTMDCVGGADCPELAVEGDPPAVLPSGAPAPLRGYSDPTLRREPDGGPVWMAYSWPRSHVGSDGNRSTRVETHLARSDDDGRRWQTVGSLWSATPATDPVSGRSGWTDHEVPNLLPVVDGSEGSTTWVGARLDLFVPDGGGLASRPLSSFRIVLVRADTPQSLASGPSATLGAAATDPRWGVDQDLVALDESLTRCAAWNEPALHHADGTLYLALRCLALDDTGTPDVVASTIEVFATEPEGEPSSWTWRHRGRLAGHDEAAELGGDGLTQIDFALGDDGALLAIITPDGWSSDHREFVHHGLRVVEVDSLDDPRLARRGDGTLAVRAEVTASDLAPLGPGAGAYEATAATGIILMRRQIGEASLVASIHDTGVHP